MFFNYSCIFSPSLASIWGVYCTRMCLTETCCEDGRCMELAKDDVQWRILVLGVLKLQVLLPERKDGPYGNKL
jgi:hypothetical protein